MRLLCCSIFDSYMLFFSSAMRSWANIDVLGAGKGRTGEGGREGGREKEKGREGRRQGRKEGKGVSSCLKRRLKTASSLQHASHTYNTTHTRLSLPSLCFGSPQVCYKPLKSALFKGSSKCSLSITLIFSL